MATVEDVAVISQSHLLERAGETERQLRIDAARERLKKALATEARAKVAARGAYAASRSEEKDEAAASSVGSDMADTEGRRSGEVID